MYIKIKSKRIQIIIKIIILILLLLYKADMNILTVGAVRSCKLTWKPSSYWVNVDTLCCVRFLAVKIQRTFIWCNIIRDVSGDARLGHGLMSYLKMPGPNTGSAWIEIIRGLKCKSYYARARIILNKIQNKPWLKTLPNAFGLFICITIRVEIRI